jgi:hypothetical protein
MKTSLHFWSYLAEFVLEIEIFQRKDVVQINAHILCLITFWNHAIYEIMWKNIVEPGGPQHAHCILDTYVYRRTYRMCNNA